ncbi:hypothetical protein BaRGS_00007983 [Batillaria attramentaria]|uniref:Uncharacterized protein n=1 Tax=Batillaria attramentaria TaxID=370345 RepID=A0ABD0LNY8_9CAEN
MQALCHTHTTEQLQTSINKSHKITVYNETILKPDDDMDNAKDTLTTKIQDEKATEGTIKKTTQVTATLALNMATGKSKAQPDMQLPKQHLKLHERIKQNI